MTTTPNRAAVCPLDDPWPPFLDLLDSDADEAWVGLDSLAGELAATRPPGPFAQLSPDDRQEVLSIAVLGLREDGFAKLRAYTDQGRPFSAWLSAVLSGRARDWLRKQRYASLTRLEEDATWSGPAPDREAELRILRDDVEKALEELPPHCRSVLQALGGGSQIRELRGALFPPDVDNKQISEKARSCRKSLLLRLKRMGYDVEDLL